MIRGQKVFERRLKSNLGRASTPRHGRGKYSNHDAFRVPVTRGKWTRCVLWTTQNANLARQLAPNGARESAAEARDGRNNGKSRQ